MRQIEVINKNNIEQVLYQPLYDENGREERRKLNIYTAFIMLFLIFVLAFNYSFVSIQVVGDSMYDTLYNGQKLYVFRFAKLDYGDIIVVSIDGSPDPYIKRVIGLEGDTVWAKDGTVYRSRVDADGETTTVALDESGYVYYDESRYPYATADFGPRYVGEGQVFFMGDNRRNSSDSRAIGCKLLSDVWGVVPEFFYK